MSQLTDFIENKFDIDEDIFLDALKLSPNAQGYLYGAITEFLLKDYLQSKNYEVRRIKEKWESEKPINHHGDFYIQKIGSKDWFVLESKGVKSNSEKWHKLYNKDSLSKFLLKHVDKTPFNSPEDVSAYIKRYLPLFENEYSHNFYTRSEIKKHTSVRRTRKLEAIEFLRGLSVENFLNFERKRLRYGKDVVKVIETHLVSGRSKISTRKQATPLMDEFHILSLDLFLRTGKHQFIFANPKHLPPSKDSDHLQQNYVIDILLKDVKNQPKIDPPWFWDIDEVFSTISNPVSEADMQEDLRLSEIEEEAEEIAAEE